MRTTLLVGLCVLVTALAPRAALAVDPSPHLRLVEPAPGSGGLDARVLRLQLAAGVGASLVAVPASMALSTALAAGSSNIVLAALPALLVFAALPPLAVAAAEWYVARDKGARFGPAAWLAAGAQVLAIVGGVMAGVWTGSLASAGLFTLAEAIVLPAVVTGAMHAFPGPVPPPAHAQPLARAAEPLPATVALAGFSF
jgi:hypothetical protein